MTDDYPLTPCCGKAWEPGYFETPSGDRATATCYGCGKTYDLGPYPEASA